jgi:hypothetical protein
VIHQDTALKVVTWDILLGVRWYDIPTFEGLERFRGLQRRYLGLMGDTKALVVSVSDATGELRFDTGARDLVQAVMADAKGHLLGMAQVIAGDGFGAASVRSVLSGIQLTVRPDYPIRVFGDTQAARPWIEEVLVAANRAELARDLGTMLLPQLELGRGHD